MFNLIEYKQSFNPAPATGDYIIRVVQAADAEEMEKKVQEVLDEIVALNATIPDASTNPPTYILNANRFMLQDVNLAGGGDGHTFTCTLTFTRYIMSSLALLGLFLAGASPSVNAGGQDVLAYPPGQGIFPPDNAAFDDHFDPAVLVVKFCLASEQDALNLAVNQMVARGIAAFPSLNGVIVAQWQQVAGAAKGTRFMGGIVLTTL
jgi:hypothetical protein